MNFNAIGILWLRQVKKYLRSKARMVGSLAQPILFLLALGFGLNGIYQKAGGGSYIDFIAPGIVAMTILFTAIFSGIELIWDRQFGFLKETLVAPISRLDIMFGRTIGGATVSVFQGLLVFGVTLLVGFKPIWWHIPFALIFLVLIAVIFTALGTAIASKMEDMQAFPLIMSFIIMPLFFLSGALFPLEGSPTALLWVARFNPLAYGVDGLRGTLMGISYFGVWMDLTVLVVVATAVLMLGSWLFGKIEA